MKQICLERESPTLKIKIKICVYKIIYEWIVV